MIDHFDATPRGMGTGYSETTKGFRTGASPHGWAFHLLHRMVIWSLHFYYLATVTSRHANRHDAKKGETTGGRGAVAVHSESFLIGF